MTEDFRKYSGLEVVRNPVNFEDCVANLRIEDCKYCSSKPNRGTNWKKCSMRVRMFLKEGGNIL
jgi:hypothetical protein